MAKVLGERLESTPPAVGNSLHGKSVSLNLKECKWFDAPSRSPDLKMDTKRPTIQIPQPGHIHEADYKCILKKLEMGHFVLGNVPVPVFIKEPEKVEEILSILGAPMEVDTLILHLKNKVINGPNNIGGYNKLEVLEKLYNKEKRTETNRNGKNRKQVVELLEAAIKYHAHRFGGVSDTTIEEEEIVNIKGAPSYKEENKAEVERDPSGAIKSLLDL